ncbi:MAG: ribosome small subunit-dependent GTPase A [Armatimonadota bacterium]|nr:ribosome small subunit-dependent GTPase A [Armatimonadota bacterium]
MTRFVGMVVRIDDPRVTVRDEGHAEWRCVLRGRLRRELTGATGPVAVGDRVEVVATGPGAGVVETMRPRRSRLARRAVTGHDEAHRGSGRRQVPREHVLAANLDLAVIVVSAPPRPAVIDRYLAMIRGGGCKGLVCVNKIDLADPYTVERVVAPYRDGGTPVVLTSARTGQGVQELRTALASKLVALIGPSGAGKSTLLNAMAPGLSLRTGGLTASGKGRHTTNWAAILQVGDALVVDTPGVREIGLLEDPVGPSSDDLFPEIAALAANCRFRDCSHTHEPGCAVKDALAAGELDPELYRRYARLARQRLDPAAAVEADRAFQRAVREARGRARP